MSFNSVCSHTPASRSFGFVNHSCDYRPNWTPLSPAAIISNGNRTELEWSPIRSVIIRVITKSDDRAAGV